MSDRRETASTPKSVNGVVLAARVPIRMGSNPTASSHLSLSQFSSMSPSQLLSMPSPQISGTPGFSGLHVASGGGMLQVRCSQFPMQVQGGLPSGHPSLLHPS